jgi:hypothetical protein
MRCEPLEFYDLKTGEITGAGFICTSGRRRRCGCGAIASLECDGPNAKRKSGTCDAAICGRCARRTGPNTDLCPLCAQALKGSGAAPPTPHGEGAPQGARAIVGDPSGADPGRRPSGGGRAASPAAALQLDLFTKARAS